MLLEPDYWQFKADRLAHSHDEILRLARLNKNHTVDWLDGEPLREFLDFKEPVESFNFTVKHLFW